MGTRITKVSVQADLVQYNAAFIEAARNTEKLAESGDKLAQREKMFRTLGLAGVAMGTAISVGLALAIAKAAEFDQAMSAVQAATHASADEMDVLRSAALSMSQGTKFSAVDAAHAIEELSKAGVSTKDIIGGGLKGALDLAAAGEMDVAQAASVASTTLGQFQLDGTRAAHVADVLAAGAGKAMGDVSDLSQALAQSGTVAAQFGISLDDTVGTLAAFASKGLLGSDAGTSFRTMLLRLANPTGQAAQLMQELGIRAYDAGGKFVGTAGLAGQLQKALGGLTQEQRNAALATIFGQDAIRAANVLYSEGAQGIQEWTAKVNDTGYAADTAAKRLDNLKGDLTKLRTAFDNALIGIGESGQDPLRVVAQALTDLLDGFNSLPEGAKSAVLAAGAVTAAVGLVGGAALLAIPKIAALKVALIELGVPASGVTSAFGAMGGALKAIPYVGAALGFTQIVNALADGALEAGGFKKSVDGLADSFKKIGAKKTVNDALGAFGGDTIKQLTSYGFFSDLQKQTDDFLRSWPRALSPGLNQLDDAINPARANLEQLDKTMAKLVSSGDAAKAGELFAALSAKTDGSKDSIAKLRTLLPEYTGALKDAKSATDDVAGATVDSTSAADAATESFQAEQDRVNQVKDAFLNLMKTINDSNDVNQKAISTNAAWQAGLDGLNDAVKKTGTSLDESTAKGSANADMLGKLAGEAQAAAQAQYEVDQKTMSAKDATDKYLGTLAEQRQKFIDSAAAAGFNRDEVAKLADRIFQMPDAKAVKILLDKADAEYELQQLTRTREMFVRVRYDQTTDSIRLGNGRAQANGGFNSYTQSFADGGMPNGIYKGGTPLYKFAEPETGWEAFLSGKASERRENIGYWLEAGRRLGVTPPQAPQKSVTRNINMNGTYYGFVPGDIAAAAEKHDQYMMAVAGIGEL